MAVNLIRNAKVFFTTMVNSTTGKITYANSTHTTSTTYEIQVLDGLSFTQSTGSDTVTLNESGATPSRGQRMFNTSLEAGDFSFSTYIRPKYSDTVADDTIDSGDTVSCEEKVLWNALLSNVAIGSVGAAYSETVGNASGPVAPYATITTANSNKNKLQQFGLIIIFDDTTYLLHNCALESATIDFGIDQVAAIQWAGKFTEMEKLATAATASGGTFGSFGTGNAYKQKITDAKYISNKLSTISIDCPAVAAYGQSAVTYTFPITGGSISIANNLSYLIPAQIGTVNKPFDYFTGTRAISGSLTAYLRSATTNSADLMSAMITQSGSYAQNLFNITIGLGGTTTTPTTTSTENKLIFSLPYSMLQIPAVNTDQVVSTTINFTAQGGTGSTSSSAYDIDSATEATIKYFSGPVV